jgi:bile acid:Na+ symporter, BASS family
MNPEIISTVIMPAGLAFIMFTLGASLTLADFRRVFLYPTAFCVGLVCHFVLLPLVTFGTVGLFGITGAMAVGYMIVSACPTGATSNLLTYHARADVALAVSFTAVASLIAMLTIPLIMSWSLTHFLGASVSGAIELPVDIVMRQIFIILGLPVTLGMICRAHAPNFVRRWHSTMSNGATGIFVVIVIAAVSSNWPMIKLHGWALAPVGVAVNVVMLTLGFHLSRLAGVSIRQSATVAIESSVQNSALAVVIAFTIIKDESMAIPAAVYSVFMYLTGITFVFIMRKFAPPRTAEEEAQAQASMH